MKTLGLIGGLSPESTVSYYTRLNDTVRRRLGGLHSAKLIVYSVDFGELEALQFAGDQQAVTEKLAAAAVALARAGADGFAILSNTKHETADDIAAAVDIPLLHIADFTATAIRDAGLDTVGLLGTRFTMERDFYRRRMHAKFGIDCIIPEAEDITIVNSIIFDELVLGQVKDRSRQKLLGVIEKLLSAGAEGLILGCTELDLILTPQQVNVPLFNSTDLHVAALAAFLLTD